MSKHISIVFACAIAALATFQMTQAQAQQKAPPVIKPDRNVQGPVPKGWSDVVDKVLAANGWETCEPNNPHMCEPKQKR